jgi:hypothetical protein
MIEPRQTVVFEGIASVPTGSQLIRVYPGFFSFMILGENLILQAYFPNILI